MFLKSINIHFHFLSISSNDKLVVSGTNIAMKAKPTKQFTEQNRNKPGKVKSLLKKKKLCRTTTNSRAFHDTAHPQTTDRILTGNNSLMSTQCTLPIPAIKAVTDIMIHTSGTQ